MVAAVTLHAPLLLTVAVRVCPATVTVTVVPGAASAVPAMVEMVLPAGVTAPPNDRARRVTTAPAPTVIAPAAMIVPENDDAAPNPAAPLTCQNTWEARAPSVNRIVLAAAVVRA